MTTDSCSFDRQNEHPNPGRGGARECQTARRDDVQSAGILAAATRRDRISVLAVAIAARGRRGRYRRDRDGAETVGRADGLD